MGFPRQEYWSGLPFPSPWDLPDPGMEPGSPALAGGFFTPEPSRKPMSYLPQLMKLSEDKWTPDLQTRLGQCSVALPYPMLCCLNRDQERVLAHLDLITAWVSSQCRRCINGNSGERDQWSAGPLDILTLKNWPDFFSHPQFPIWLDISRFCTKPG